MVSISEMSPRIRKCIAHRRKGPRRGQRKRRGQTCDCTPPNDELERRAVSEQPETTTRQVLFGLSSEPVPLARSKRWLEGTPTSTTVRGRRFGGKRSQMRLALSAPRRQPKRAWGSIAPPHQPNVLGARPAPNRSRCQPHAHSEAPNEDACRTIKSATINAIAELKRSGPSHLFATLKRPK